MWDWQWEGLVPFSWVQQGWAQPPVGPSSLGRQNSRDLLSCSSLWQSLGVWRAVEASGCCHYAPAYLQKQQLPRLSDMCLPRCKPSPNLPSCGWRNCLLFSSCVFRGQDLVLCNLLRGAAQIRIWSNLGLMCVVSLCTDNHSIRVGNSSVELTDLKQTTAVWLSSHTLKIYGQVVPRQAGIFYR